MDNPETAGYVREDEDIWLGQLAQAAQAGDRTARDSLWAQVEPRLHHTARRAAWYFPTLDRDDAVQESFPIFAALVGDWPGPTTGGTGFATYLFGLFRWRLHSALRAYERRGASTHADWHTREGRTRVPTAGKPTLIAWQEYGVDYRAFVVGLPPQEREIFLLRVEQGLGTREVATRLGLTPRTVSRCWNVTLRRLRAIARRSL